MKRPREPRSLSRFASDGGQARLAVDSRELLLEDLQDGHDLDRAVGRSAGEGNRGGGGVEVESAEARRGCRDTLVGVSPVLVDTAEELDRIALDERSDPFPVQPGLGQADVVGDRSGRLMKCSDVQVGGLQSFSVFRLTIKRKDGTRKPTSENKVLSLAW